MVKILSIVCSILAVCAYTLFSMYTDSQKEITVLESEKNGLINAMKGYQNAEVEANLTIKQLRNQIRDNKESTDWYNTPIPTDVLDIIRKRHNRKK